MKKITFKTILLLVLAVVSFANVSCKKDKGSNPGGESFVQFKLDGVQKKFTVSSILNNHISDGYLDMICSQTSDTAVNSIEIRVTSDSPINTGEAFTYPYSILLYKDETSKQHYSYSAVPSTLTFSSISGSRIQGTFSGGIKDGSGATKTVSDGSFDIAL